MPCTTQWPLETSTLWPRSSSPARMSWNRKRGQSMVLDASWNDNGVCGVSCVLLWRYQALLFGRFLHQFSCEGCAVLGWSPHVPVWTSGHIDQWRHGHMNTEQSSVKVHELPNWLLKTILPSHQCQEKNHGSGSLGFIHVVLRLPWKCQWLSSMCVWFTLGEACNVVVFSAVLPEAPSGHSVWYYVGIWGRTLLASRIAKHGIPWGSGFRWWWRWERAGGECAADWWLPQCCTLATGGGRAPATSTWNSNNLFATAQLWWTCPKTLSKSLSGIMESVPSFHSLQNWHHCSERQWDEVQSAFSNFLVNQCWNKKHTVRTDAKMCCLVRKRIFRFRLCCLAVRIQGWVFNHMASMVLYIPVCIYLRAPEDNKHPSTDNLWTPTRNPIAQTQEALFSFPDPHEGSAAHSS